MANDLKNYIYKGNIICSLDELFKCYKEIGNVWEVAKIVGGSGQTIHKILKKYNKNKIRNKVTPELIEFVKNNYIDFKNNLKAKEISKLFNVSDILISRLARKYHLTSDVKIELSKDAKCFLQEKMKITANSNLILYGHPKGMLGKKHNENTRKYFSKIVKERWTDPTSSFNTKEFRQKKSDIMSKFQNSRLDHFNNFTKGKKGHYITKCGKSIYMRSSWELNYACYLDYLIDLKEISKWEYEVDVFWFEKIKRGVRSYKPDFKVYDMEGNFIYHEVKGWMDDKSKTKLNRMRIYYPNIKILIIDQKYYNNIKKNFSHILSNWDKFIE